MWFLSVGPEICLQLPSDSTSRWTPLLFSYTLPTIWACSGLSPVRARPWRANIKKNVLRHILAPSAVACDKLHLCASAHHWHVSAFLCNREFLGSSCYIKKDRCPTDLSAKATVLFSYRLFSLIPYTADRFHCLQHFLNLRSQYA